MPPKKPETNQAPQGNPNQGQGQGQMSRDEQIGFHKGALNTLINERNELIKMVQVVDQFLQGHIKALEQLGVKIQSGEKK
ncbi:hypothetical protein COU57_03410 [Candidatus Pacearchaeota archaeon CG10_big_fil_rev_8_21_14_0_10_32_14]|nr:MAG: hypothetical protein COU57_03410 [Candidatus Pacearchaeota archaeon CG10_big_fil_rev_8_21_14_0_10_32_14]